ncbi:MAG: alpha-L-rhamnosidase [Planctomycetota bacterium]|nr:alpha-L-rhamnosidase [Planctomycetota bacterium]
MNRKCFRSGSDSPYGRLDKVVHLWFTMKMKSIHGVNFLCYWNRRDYHAFVLFVAILGLLPGERCSFSVMGQSPEVAIATNKSPLTTFVIQPQRIVWTSDEGVTYAEHLLQPKNGQAVLVEPTQPVQLQPGSGLVIDFGKEIAGSIEIFTPMTPSKEPRTVRVRFGESVTETMAELNERGSQNDHAIRDQIVTLPWLGKTTIGPSGFRFVRIDAVDQKLEVQISQVRALLTLRDIPYIGSFQCSDERLNTIWNTGAYTVHLNMQDYLWDGIKRDRLVWLGDMHPEVSVINAVFGYNEVVPRSLDLIRDVTPVNQWMNGISSYSMWWVIIHEDWYLYQGNLEYLRAQQPYLAALLKRISHFVAADGMETLDGMRFLDWPTFENEAAVHEGLQAMMAMSMQSGARLMEVLGDRATAAMCESTVKDLRQHVPPASGRKSPAALLALAGLRDPREVAAAIKQGGPSDLSTFYGFYVLNALAKSGDIDTALDFISQYWGGMIDFGATTFWEDFDLQWTTQASRIDELLPAGKKDLHGDFGAHCYLGFRHSFCHGWAGGPTAWLTQNVLGVRPLAPGCCKVEIAPNLGHLSFAEGTFPTPHGAIHVRHDKQTDGSIKTVFRAPPNIEVLVSNSSN